MQLTGGGVLWPSCGVSTLLLTTWCQHLTMAVGFLHFQDELASHTMPHMNWLPDGQSSHEPPAARSLREYEEFAGISFEKRKLSVPRRSVGNQNFLLIPVRFLSALDE